MPARHAATIGGRAPVDPTASLGALVADRPARAPLFERLRLDYCCGGGETLAEACEQRALDLETVLALLDALDDADGSAVLEDHDWRRASLAELCDHIVAIHHDGLRRDLPRIAELLATVVRVHGSGHPELRDLQRVFASLRDELEPHLELEERALFPACRALAAATPATARIDEALLAAHEHDHQHTGDALAALRVLAGDYDPAGALCGTHRALLDALRALELDLHQHVHEENNVLFPRAREASAARSTSAEEGRAALTVTRPRVAEAPGAAPAGRRAAADQGGDDALLPCCRGWIVEETRRQASGRAGVR